MGKMTDAMNTYNPALNLIIREGFEVSIFEDEEKAEDYEWKAEKPGMTFIASDPLRLLALITVWKTHGENWNKQRIPDCYDTILTKHFSE